VRLHHLENEDVVLSAQPVVRELAFEIGIAVGEQRRADLRRRCGLELELLELVDAGV